MKHSLVAAAAAVGVVLCANLTAASSRTASVITIWRIPAPQAVDASVQSLEAGVVAINLLSPQFAALARHPGARMTLAIDPVFVASLERQASGDSVLTGIASGQIGADDARATQMLDMLSSNVVPSTEVATSVVGKRFISDASAARLLLMGDRAAQFSQRDDVDFAAAALLVSLASNGDAGAQAFMLKQDTLTSHDLQVLSAAFARACRDLLDKTKKAAAAGTIEIAALPAYEPIMPLIINAGGRTSPFTVNLDGGADVAVAVSDGLRMARSLAPAQGAAGILSPSGAYNDETASLLQQQHAAYGIFSERVVKANAGSSAVAVSDVHSAAFRAYLLETSKTSKLPVLFCSDATSNALDSQPPSAPATAIADRLAAAVNAALAIAPEPTVLVVCLSGTGTVLHRPDRATVLDDLAAMLASGRPMRGTTPKDYLREHPPTADTYGYAPGSDVGGFALWMGSANQMNMWTALANARKAAGGDAAVANAQVRDPLLRAESGFWFLTLMLPQPRYLTDQSLSTFRDLISDIYRGAGKPVPADVSPVQMETPAPVGIPGH